MTMYVVYKPSLVAASFQLNTFFTITGVLAPTFTSPKRSDIPVGKEKGKTWLSHIPFDAVVISVGEGAPSSH